MAPPTEQQTLDQWRMLAAVIDQGGFAQAAESLGKSQSAVSYGVQRLQKALGIALLTMSGRKAVLTKEGEILLRRARHVLEEVNRLQSLAVGLISGAQAVIRLAVDVIFPSQWLFAALTTFSQRYPDTRIELLETVLSGGSEALLNKEAELVITSRIPPGFLGEKCHTFQFIAVAHPDHPLHKQKKLTLRDLSQHRQIVVRDSGIKQKVDSGWLGAEQRWTVSHMRTSIEALTQGLGFAWIPKEKIKNELDLGLLKILPMEIDSARDVPLYIAFADRDEVGEAINYLASLIKTQCEDN
jgi:DNA-binding transcriptional LysR family regulator